MLATRAPLAKDLLRAVLLAVQQGGAMAMNAAVTFVSPELLAAVLRLPEGIRISGIESHDRSRRFRIFLTGPGLPEVQEAAGWPEVVLWFSDGDLTEIRPR